ncbi:AraC family transcriptional regulator [Paucibacter sp. R3-3]|uniref:AraC family transcriptional regulator n=1 Tax=Roseateles agri TaxID=3098619 RepID=A0ABU5DG00_9BURK|nr:AraC family transcriptional regulator [Paucibacter sp. R3-3]MDY0745213.1 AraC family transcriptional regulator [Paucibacter sp. R3-3]
MLPLAIPAPVDAAAWGRRIRESFFPLELEPASAAGFAAEARLSVMPRCRIARVRASAHRVTMRPQSCRPLQRRQLKILWLLAGSARLRQNGVALDVPAGHWTVYEATQPYELSMSEGAECVAALCEMDDGGAFDELHAGLAGQVLPTEGGAAVVLAAVDAVNAAGERFSPASKAGTADFISSLLLQDLQFRQRCATATRRRTPEALLAEARRFVLLNLESPELSPDQIAAALNVCRRSLYLAFEPTGETPQALVQRLRLERCRDLLGRAPASSITEIALDHGFSDPAYFARLFRRRFGITPSQCRAGR